MLLNFRLDVRVLLIHLFIVFLTLLGARLVTGHVSEGDHNTMNAGGGGGLALPVPLPSSAVPMQMRMVQPPPMTAASMHKKFASQQIQHTYATFVLQDFAAHRQMPMSPISLDETRV